MIKKNLLPKYESPTETTGELKTVLTQIHHEVKETIVNETDDYYFEEHQSDTDDIHNWIDNPLTVVMGTYESKETEHYRQMFLLAEYSGKGAFIGNMWNDETLCGISVYVFKTQKGMDHFMRIANSVCEGVSSF